MCHNLNTKNKFVTYFIRTISVISREITLEQYFNASFIWCILNQLLDLCNKVGLSTPYGNLLNLSNLVYPTNMEV